MQKLVCRDVRGCIPLGRCSSCESASVIEHGEAYTASAVASECGRAIDLPKHATKNLERRREARVSALCRGSHNRHWLRLWELGFRTCDRRKRARSVGEASGFPTNAAATREPRASARRSSSRPRCPCALNGRGPGLRCRNLVRRVCGAASRTPRSGSAVGFPHLGEGPTGRGFLSKPISSARARVHYARARRVRAIVWHASVP